MRSRILLIASLVLNLACLSVLVWVWRRSPVQVEVPRPPEMAAANVTVRTNVIVRRQNVLWRDIESADYTAYINNLRAVGCPEDTIRDIIVADVDDLYARRRSVEIVTPQQQWWRSDPDPEVAQTAVQKVLALDQERRELLTRLLGPGWDKTPLPDPRLDAQALLNGPILGDVSAEARASVQDILARASQQLAQETRDGALDPKTAARLRKETREALARVLTAPQFEEYLLRYSQNATELREQLRGLDINPEEFRGLFRAVDNLDQEIQLRAGEDEPASAKIQKGLAQQRDAALERELGTERARMYRLNQDPVFREARAAAEQHGVPPESVLPLYELNHELETERARIQRDATLTPEEREEAILDAQKDWQSSLRKVLGDDLYRRYRGEAPVTPGVPGQ